MQRTQYGQSLTWQLQDYVANRVSDHRASDSNEPTNAKQREAKAELNRRELGKDNNDKREAVGAIRGRAIFYVHERLPISTAYLHALLILKKFTFLPATIALSRTGAHAPANQRAPQPSRNCIPPTTVEIPSH